MNAAHRKPSHEDITLKYLREHRNGMTARDAQKLGIDRLSARIWNLRNDGYTIDTEFERNKKNDGNHARYFLIKEKKTKK